MISRLHELIARQHVCDLREAADWARLARDVQSEAGANRGATPVTLHSVPFKRGRASC